MKLEVLSNSTGDSPWYAEQGLKFTCTQCGNCCTGGPGYVWLTREEIVRLAEHLEITPQEAVDKYCRKINGRFSLKERRTREGNYDCIFLTEQDRDPNDPKAGRRRTCAIYEVRPLQCRTWPFWKENISTPQRWEQSSKRCPGMGRGRRFSLNQIHAIRDAADWPKNPPTSKKPT
jgi:Fe-S-cluster containining protein